MTFQPNAGCPFLRIADGYVKCQAVSWGKKLDGSDDYMPITRELINYCSGTEYKECPDYRKACILEDAIPLKRALVKGAVDVLNGPKVKA